MNAAFSGATGLLLLLASPTVATWLGPHTPRAYALLGAGLTLFCATLAIVAVRPTPLAVLAITVADLGWVAFTTVALLAWRNDFAPLGFILVFGTNAAVAAFAWLQQRSIRRTFQVRGGLPDEYQVCVAVDAPVSANAFWRVLADLGAIQRYMPALKSSVLTVGLQSGEGCIRTCENFRGEVWSERCVEWNEGSSFALDFLTDAPGFPFPFSKMIGGWRVAPKATGCQVEVWWRVVPRRPWTAVLVLPLMAAYAQRTFAAIVQRMAFAAQELPLDSNTLASFPRLRAAFC